MRHVTDLTDVGRPGMQQPRHRLPGAVRRRDGLGQSPAHDITRGLLPRDRHQGAASLPGEDAGPPVPGQRGLVVRLDHQRRSIFPGVAGVKLAETGP